MSSGQFREIHRTVAISSFLIFGRFAAFSAKGAGCILSGNLTF